MAEKLTKAELIDALYDSLSPTSRTTRKEIHELIDGLFAEIKGAILDGKIVELRGFGTFEVKLRKGRSKAWAAPYTSFHGAGCWAQLNW